MPKQGLRASGAGRGCGLLARPARGAPRLIRAERAAAAYAFQAKADLGESRNASTRRGFYVCPRSPKRHRLGDLRLEPSHTREACFFLPSGSAKCQQLALLPFAIWISIARFGSSPPGSRLAERLCFPRGGAPELEGVAPPGRAFLLGGTKRGRQRSSHGPSAAAPFHASKLRGATPPVVPHFH